MTNKELKQKYEKAFSNAVPDVFDAVLQQCDTETTEKTVIVTMPKLQKTVLRKIASIAAAVAIILTSCFAGYSIAKIDRVDAVICFDVNPSIEIEINDEEKIVGAKGKNDDGQKILGEMDLKGSDLSVAVNAIIGSMLRNGYLDEISNSILISVDSSDKKKGEALESKLIEEINLILSGESFNAAVLSQTLNATKEIKELASEYGITIGKAQLIKQITDNGAKYSFTDLASLSIQQLNLIISGENVEINKVDKTEKERIGKSKAKQIALKAAKLENEKIYNYKCELNDENRNLVYIVTFDTDKDAYSYTINAYNGKIKDRNITKGTYFGIEKAKALALESVGATEEEIELFTYSFVGDKYSMYFRLGLVDYRVSVDAHLGEIVSIRPQSQTNPNVTPTYISEADVKAIVLEQLETTEDKIFDYSCIITKNGNLPVFEAKCKLNYDTSFEKGILNCTYVIVATTGEVVGVGKELIKSEDATTSENSQSDSSQVSSDSTQSTASAQ